MVTVSVVEAVPGGVTVCGEKLHDAPDGNPAQLNETAELNPFTGDTLTAIVAFCPCWTESEAGEAAIVKSGDRVVAVEG